MKSLFSGTLQRIGGQIQRDKLARGEMVLDDRAGRQYEQADPSRHSVDAADRLVERIGALEAEGSDAKTALKKAARETGSETRRSLSHLGVSKESAQQIKDQANGPRKRLAWKRSAT